LRKFVEFEPSQTALRQRFVKTLRQFAENKTLRDRLEALRSVCGKNSGEYLNEVFTDRKRR